MFRKVLTVSLGISLIAAAVSADTWKMDKPHTSIGFTVSHLVIAKVRGTFEDFDGVIQFDGKNVENGSVDITIQMASVDTENEKRDNHLKSPDFFDVESYPVMTFKSKKVVKGKGSDFQIIGDLTLRGVTKEVILDAVLNGIINDPMIGNRAGFSATGVINRQDFGVKWNRALESGDFLVGDQVAISIETELVRAE